MSGITSLLIILGCVVSQFDLGAISIAVWLVIFLILLLLKKQAKIFLNKLFTPLVSILAIAIISWGGKFNEVDLWATARDLFYLLQPLVILLLAYFCSVNKLASYIQLLRLTVISISIVSLLKFCNIILDPSVVFNLGIESRYGAGIHNKYAIIGLIVLTALRKAASEERGTSRFYWINYTILLFSLFLSFSRTDYLLFLIVSFVPFICRKKVEAKSFIISIVLVSSVLAVGGIVVRGDFDSNDVTVIGKFTNSISEIAIRDMDDKKDIVSNWRGYEALLGIQKVAEGSIPEIIAGQGLGSYATTPYWIFNGEILNELPIFHNGYITVLLKAGVVGLVIYLYFIYSLFRVGSFSDVPVEKILLASSGYFIFIKTLFTHGVYSNAPPILILFLIGLSVGSVKYSKY